MDYSAMSMSSHLQQTSNHGPGSNSNSAIKLEARNFIKLEAPDYTPLKLDPDFEPQSRARSNTWPQPRPDDPSLQHSGQAPLQEHDAMGQSLLGGFPKKSTSRRNAWGNMSYADLITQAIQSSPDKRLTLSQIYDWMVTNVSYFKDKGDSNSSAGWKNSIRHNLSLHNRFMRVQNEGTGKSSWWMLNPDAKPGKAARRRATSMETSKFEKKRGRIKKKIEAMRNGGSILDTPSPSSSLSEGLDLFPDSPHQVHNFNLSPSDFRGRTSSNASSCGGRLSPILGEGGDHHGNSQGGPPISTWDYPSYAYGSSGLVGSDRFGTEQLALGLANTMKLHESGGISSYDFHQQGYPSPQVIGGRQSGSSTNTSNETNANAAANNTSTNAGAAPTHPLYSLQEKFYPYYSNYRTAQGQSSEELESKFRSFAGSIQNGVYRRPSHTIPTTVKNEREPQLLNGIYGTTFQPYLSGTNNHHLLQHVDTKGMSSIHHPHDLDFNVDVDRTFECNVDEVLRSEPGILGDDFDDFGPNPGAPNHLQPNQNVTNPCSAPGSPYQSTVHHHQQSNGRQWTSVLH